MLDMNCVRSNFGNAVTARCFEGGCELKLNGLRNYIVLKGEELCRNLRICDSIIFVMGHEVITGIIELKSKTTHVDEVVKKLYNGSKIALGILEKCSDGSTGIEFYHLVLSKGYHSSEYKMLISRKIEIRGRKHRIIPKRCGVSLSNVISRLRS